MWNHHTWNFKIQTNSKYKVQTKHMKTVIFSMQGNRQDSSMQSLTEQIIQFTNSFHHINQENKNNQ